MIPYGFFVCEAIFKFVSVNKRCDALISQNWWPNQSMQLYSVRIISVNRRLTTRTN